MAHLLHTGAFAIYSGERNIRKPLLYYLENDYNFQGTRDPNAQSVHVKLDTFNGCTKINPLNENEIGVIYTDIKYDSSLLKLFCSWALKTDSNGVYGKGEDVFGETMGF